METYRIENLSFAYTNQPVTERNRLNNAALRGISLTVKPGDFITICGASGSGKTTLLRQLKPSLAPIGKVGGKIFFEGAGLEELAPAEEAAKIGFVTQSPDNQIVTNNVWHELAFGLENLAVPPAQIRMRVAEAAHFFGIHSWFHKPTTELSGGQKQVLLLASIIVMSPTVLILDEPTSRLDPIAAEKFFTLLAKINRELGITVILTEHRTEEALPLSSKLVVLEKGRVVAEGEPRAVGWQLASNIRESTDSHGMFLAMPTPMRIWSACGGVGDCPITVAEGKAWLEKKGLLQNNDFVGDAARNEIFKQPVPGKIAVTIKNLWFRYQKTAQDVIKNLNFSARYNEITALLGGNGTGKTTIMSLIAGLLAPYRGKVILQDRDKTCLLPQNPQTLFVGKTVEEDLSEIFVTTEKPTSEHMAEVVKLCRLEGLLQQHPYDLSGGEMQRAALAKILLLEPKILLLDEPTKGFDAEYKQNFAAILKELAASGCAVILCSHDIEFCAQYADRCALVFDGGIVTENTRDEFFRGNSFYTTAANRMARHILPQAVTVEDVTRELCKLTKPSGLSLVD